MFSYYLRVKKRPWYLTFNALYVSSYHLYLVICDTVAFNNSRDIQIKQNIGEMHVSKSESFIVNTMPEFSVLFIIPGSKVYKTPFSTELPFFFQVS